MDLHDKLGHRIDRACLRLLQCYGLAAAVYGRWLKWEDAMTTLNELGLLGNCVICERPITERDYAEQRVIATGDRRTGWTVACAEHFFSRDGQTRAADYKKSIRALAAATARRLGYLVGD